MELQDPNFSGASGSKEGATGYAIGLAMWSPCREGLAGLWLKHAKVYFKRAPC